jgi:hypothetical protein
MEHTLFAIAKLGTTALGLLIAYQAYRGYRRHGSPLLLYVGLGFGLISFGSLLEGLLFELFDLAFFQAGFVAAVLSGAGMVSILYALYAPDP